MKARTKSCRIFLCLLVQLIMLVVVSACFAKGLESEKSTFWIVWNNGWRFLNFGILIFFLVKWLKEPLAAYLKSYRDLVKREIEDAESAEKRAEQEYEEVQKRLEKLDSEVAKIHELAVKQGKAEKERIIADARLHAEGIVERARITAFMMVEDAKKKLKEELVEMIVRTAEEKISKSINEQDQQRLVQNYVESLSKAPKESIGGVSG